MDEAQREEIRMQAKQILDNFSAELEKVKVSGGKDKVGEVGGFRVEGSGETATEDFRKSMFDNAPESEGDCLMAEKKKW